MNQSEFLTLVMPFKDKVFRFAKRLLVSTEEAEDATQELYFKLWNNKEKLKLDYYSAKPFPHLVIENLCPIEKAEKIYNQIPELVNKSRDYMFAGNKFEKSNYQVL